MRIAWEKIYVKNAAGSIRGSPVKIPAVKIKISYGEKKTPAVHALVDSGAQSLLMSKEFADFFGVDLSSLEGLDSAGATGCFKRYRVEGVRVTIMGIGEEYEVEAAFTDAVDENGDYHPVIPLLGLNAVFHKYLVTIDAVAKTIDFVPHSPR